MALRKQPAGRLAAEGVDGLVGGCEQTIEAEFAGRMAETSRIGALQKLGSGGVHKLQHVVAIKGEQGGDHHLEDAGQQRRGFKRAHALFLQQVGKGVDFAGQFAQGIGRAGAAGAEGIVAFAQ